MTNVWVSVRQLGMHPADRAALQAWMDWIDDFTVYFLHTLEMWLKLRETAQKEGRDAADALPCIRLLPDMHFAKRLVQVLVCWFCCNMSLRCENVKMCMHV